VGRGRLGLPPPDVYPLLAYGGSEGLGDGRRGLAVGSGSRGARGWLGSTRGGQGALGRKSGAPFFRRLPLMGIRAAWNGVDGRGAGGGPGVRCSGGRVGLGSLWGRGALGSDSGLEGRSLGCFSGSPRAPAVQVGATGGARVGSGSRGRETRISRAASFRRLRLIGVRDPASGVGRALPAFPVYLLAGGRMSLQFDFANALTARMRAEHARIGDEGFSPQGGSLRRTYAAAHWDVGPFSTASSATASILHRQVGRMVNEVAALARFGRVRVLGVHLSDIPTSAADRALYRVEVRFQVPSAPAVTPAAPVAFEVTDGSLLALGAAAALSLASVLRGSG